MDTRRYLERIQYPEPIQPDAQALRELQIAHMLHVPFENLDIARRRPLALTEQALWQKIVVQGRGGFCYELNGLFARLLQQLGYDVTYLNARVYHPTGQLGMDYDHLALLVQAPGQPERWLVDVGFGDSFLEPLRLEAIGDQEQGLRAYRLEQTSGGYSVWQRDYDGAWERQYFFDLQPHLFPEEYEAGCLYHQTSPRSSFTRGSLISKATPEGRITLQDGCLILTINGQRTERPLKDRVEYDKLLKQYFDISFAESYP